VNVSSEGRRRYRPAGFGRIVLLVVGLALVAVLGLVAFRSRSALPRPTRHPSGTAAVDNPSPQWLTEAGGSLLFVAKDPTHGRELWASDGTPSGTVLVKDIRPGAHGSGPSELAAVGGTLFFSANDGISGRELWMSDGTAEGTVLVDDIVPGTKGFGQYGPYAFADVGGTLFFTADDGIHGYELWTSDGTAEGTRQVRDIHQGPGDSWLQSPVGSNGLVFFTANDGGHGPELWRSDGTSSGTILLRNLTDVRGTSWSGSLTDVDGTLFFTPSDGDLGELWRTDGSPRGTVLVRDFTKFDDCWFGPRYGYIDFCVSQLAASDGALYLVAYKRGVGDGLWRTDGTSEGTVLVRDLGSSGPMSLTDVAGTLFFVEYARGVGDELWRTDGTSEGTVLVRDIAPGRKGSAPYTMTAVDDVVYFWPQGLVPGAELWMSDGTKSGTVLVRDVLPEVKNASLSWLTAVGHSLFFVATDGEASHLWTSDGTEQSTIRLM